MNFRQFIDRVCKHAYSLALILAVVTIGFTPIHSAGTQHADVVQVLPNSRIAVEGDFTGLSIGDELPLLRFNPGWRSKIGDVRIESIEGSRLVASYDPSTFLWPMGMQGRVVSEHGRRVELNIGSSIGLQPQQRLQVFEGNRAKTSIHVVSVEEDRAVAVKRTETPLAGQIVTAYSVKNTVSWFDRGPLLLLEWSVLLGALGLWLWSVVSPTPGRLIGGGMSDLRRRAAQASLPLRLAGHTVIGVLVSVFVGRLTFWSLTYLLAKAGTALRSKGVDVPFRLVVFPEQGAWFAIAGVAVAYFSWLLIYRRSPVRAAWHALSFRPFSLERWGLPNYLLYWALHLFVFYAFTNTLTDVITANLRVVSGHGWPGAPLAFGTNRETLTSAFYMLTHAPSARSMAEGFTIVRLIIWSTTIAVCLVLYLHTVVSILWKKPVRNIDFTPTGWLLNAVCYGPLLGSVIHHMFPPSPETLPAITDGPWLVLQPSVELLTNILYAASIFNLGTMFGVMVDKGVRKSGFYSVVRHPSYTLEALMFILILLPGMHEPAHWLYAMVFPLKYWLRSERDDIFMTGANPEFAPYKQKVPWKFARGVY